MTAASKQPIRVAGIEVQFLVDAGDSGGSSTAFVVRVAPGAGTPPPHSHGGFDETVYGIDGVFTYTVDGVKQQADRVRRCSCGAARCTGSRTSATSMHRC
jgi:quercetin dioxygenase-like cupin family protein